MTEPTPSKTDLVKAAIPEMVKLYESGQTVLAIASQFGFAVETVRVRLVEAGVKMRPIARVNRSQKPPKQRNSHDGRRPPLSQEEVERLRKLVGYRPGQS